MAAVRRRCCGCCAGEIEPLDGSIKRATALRTVYFDQNRILEPDVTLRRALAPDSDSVIYQDRVIHVASWAARFLFSGDQLNQPVGRLSGGERARVLIARLMLEPADLLLLDEPTNDLDIPTLEILEESLLEFRGALVLVTHDRYMLDRVSTTRAGTGWTRGAPSASPITRNGMPGNGSPRRRSSSRRAGEADAVAQKEALLSGSARICRHRRSSDRGRGAGRAGSAV